MGAVCPTHWQLTVSMQAVVGIIRDSAEQAGNDWVQISGFQPEQKRHNVQEVRFEMTNWLTDLKLGHD